MNLFTPEEREALRETLILMARHDTHISGAAHVGSASVGKEDRWSDIDLALCLTPVADFSSVAAAWTNTLYRDHRALAHLDIWRGSTLYRVFLLDSTLQVDLSFWLPTEFGATGRTFRLVFGTAQERPTAPAADPLYLVGMGWLYALHVRSSLARGRVWQADFMLRGMRDQVLALVCLRHQLTAYESREVDDLPPEILAALEQTLVTSLKEPELRRAFEATMELLRLEINIVDADVAERLADSLTLLTRPVQNRRQALS